VERLTIAITGAKSKALRGARFAAGVYRLDHASL
jgi:hypothetical protein